MIFSRTLDLKNDLKRKSLFLFGPRQTGKTHYLKNHFPKSPFYNLLQGDVFLKLSQRPHQIREEMLQKKHSPHIPIIIDEIQKLPSLLDEVHSMIEDSGYRFILTGSSARKLKRGGANLLGGRALIRYLFPLTSFEIPNDDLLKYLNFGGLPSIYASEAPEKDLLAYVGTYLQEEIRAEGLVRKVENFSRFLEVAALCNARMVNYESISSDAAVPVKSVAEYFQILEDTMIGSLLPAYQKTKKRKAITTGKFYFFDSGVSNVLSNRLPIRRRTEAFGDALEHFVWMELRAYLSYREIRKPLSYWRSTSNIEVDFVIGDEMAIEVKGTERLADRHMAGLKAFSEDVKLKHKIIVCCESSPRRVGDIQVLPIHYFLKELWNDAYAL